MVIDDFMFYVAKGWYRLYWGIIVVLNAFVLGGSIATRYVHAFAHLGHLFNMGGQVTVVLSGLTLLYMLTGFLVIRRFSVAVATLVATMLNALVLLNAINNTGAGPGALPYIGVWIITNGLNGIYGLPVLLGSVLVSMIYVLLQSDFHPARITKNSWILLFGSAVLAGLAYPFWKSRFVSRQDQQMNKLSGMLKTNQEQSAILIQSIADGVIVTNTEGQITLMNRTAANMTGWTVDEATGVDVKLVLKITKENGEEVSGDDYPFNSVLIHKAYINQMLQVSSRSGDKKVIVSLVISPVVTSSGSVYGAVAVLRDVSDQRAAEKQSADFISTASHEMRTPVAAIEGYLALALNDKVSTIDTRARGFLEKAHSSTQHLGQLFQDLLTSSKAEDGRLTNHPAVVEMGGFMEQLSDDLRFSAQKKGLAAEFVVGSGETIDATNPSGTALSSQKVLRPLYYVYVDPDRLREVITNLFDNGVKYTDSGKISLGLTGNDKVVQVYIRDTGPGIPADDIPHLFQKFYRVDSSATRTIGGTGLGLFICRKIIELYHGRIWVESKLGEGSTFFINLPRIDTAKADQLQKQAASAAASSATPAAPAKV